MKQTSELIKMSKISKNGSYLFEWEFEIYPGKLIEFVKTQDGRIGYKEFNKSQYEADIRDEERKNVYRILSEELSVAYPDPREGFRDMIEMNVDDLCDEIEKLSQPNTKEDK